MHDSSISFFLCNSRLVETADSARKKFSKRKEFPIFHSLRYPQQLLSKIQLIRSNCSDNYSQNIGEVL